MLPVHSKNFYEFSSIFIIGGEKAHSLAGPSRPRKRSIADVDDYLFGPQKSVKRRRADPKVCNFFDYQTNVIEFIPSLNIFYQFIIILVFFIL